MYQFHRIGFVCLILVASLTGHGSSVAEAAIVESTTAPTETSTTSEPVVVTPAVTLPQITIENIPGGDVALGDFVVGPGRSEITVEPGKSTVVYVTVTNRIDDERTFEFAVEDMSGSASGEESTVLLGDQAGPYSLRDYISFPSPSVTLGLGERARVPVTVSMPPNAEPGGYYGAVLVSTIQAPSERASSGVSSPIIARIGTLFFITVPGSTEYAGSLADFSTITGGRFFTEGPIRLGATYQNSGSMHLNPYGEIRIKNLLGAEVGYIEVDPWFVLPQALRTREVVWDAPLLLGRYTIDLSMNRGYDDIVDEATVVVWILPWKVLAMILGGVFLIAFIIKFFLSTFELKRKS